MGRAQWVPQSDDAAYPRHQNEEETPLNNTKRQMEAEKQLSLPKPR